MKSRKLDAQNYANGADFLSFGFLVISNAQEFGYLHEKTAAEQAWYPSHRCQRSPSMET